MREQIYQHLPLRVNYTEELSIMPLLHVLHGETLWYLSLSSLSRGPWSNYICKRQRPRQYIRWMAVTLCKITEIMLPATSADVFLSPLILCTIAVNNSRARLWNHVCCWHILPGSECCRIKGIDPASFESRNKEFRVLFRSVDRKVAGVPRLSTLLVWSRTRILSKFALLASAKIPLAVTLTNTFRGPGPQRSSALYGGKKGTRLKDQCFFSLSFFAHFQGAERGSDQSSWLGQQCHLLNEMFLRQKVSLLVYKYYSTQALC